MGSYLLRVFGHKASHKVMQRHTRRGGFLDIKYGFALFKDRNVSATSKLLALTIGVAVTGLLLALEVPLELILGIFLPFVGEAADLLIDGVEVVLFPMLVACIVLPRMTRQPSYVRPAAPPYQGEIIDISPPILH